MSLKMIIVRHGETDWNSLRMIQGWKDIPLNKTGIEKSIKTAKYINNNFNKINKIYSSDLKRAYQTAKPISELLNIPITTNQNLREQSFGELEGNEIDNLKKNDLDLFKKLKFDKNNYNKNNIDAETHIQFKNRIMNELNSIINSHKNEDKIIIVTHGGVIRIILYYWLNIHNDNFYFIKNNSISILDIENNKPKIEILNNVEFL